MTDAAQIDTNALEDGFTGEVLTQGDHGYDEARRVHNGLIDRCPAVIARCQQTADVVDAVNFARRNELEISVRGGGHSVAGRAVTDRGIMIDLAPMRGIHVDPLMGTARAQGGVTWAEYNRATHLHGRATTGGTVSSTGIAGLTLGGGVGWLMSKYGMAVDNLVSVELVTADGKVRTVNADHEPDLFWAVRGGGGNFGVATWFEYRTHPLTTVIGGLTAYPLDEAGQVFATFRQVCADASDDLVAVCGLVHAPDGSGTKLAATIMCHVGDQRTAEAELAPLRSAGTVLMDAVGPMPYPVVNTLLDDGFPKGARNYWKSAFFKELDDRAVQVMVDALRAAPSIMSGIVVEHFHGAATRIGATETAFPHREVGYNLILAAEWLDPSDDGSNLAWTRETFGDLAPYMADANYVNYLDHDDLDRTRAAYGPNWQRLVNLKRQFDPDNLFHLNHNIDPNAE